ncbi:MAG: hypothetical protein KAX05_11365 [Bacteroidales bacterium]|nr:hypothetical protein [Bacteroidales bacterium]
MKAQVVEKNGFPRPLGILLILIILSILCFPVAIFSQYSDQDSEYCDKEEVLEVNRPELFSNDEIMSVTIATDLNTLVCDIGDTTEYHKAILSYILPGEDTVSLNVSIKTRGNFRKDRNNCDFPPLCIKFSKKEVKNTIFEGQDKIKLVTHCRTGESEYEQFLFQEYLIYKLYNLLTPYSFRVRLLDVNYVDIWDPRHSVNSYAFMIERPKHMASRNGGEIRNVINLSSEEVELHNYTLLSLFQYMIINNDWSVTLLHNVKLISIDTAMPSIPVPYDFDWAGIVNAPYRFSADSEKDFMTDRDFKGKCETLDELSFFLNYMKSKSREIYDLYMNSGLLNRKHEAITLQVLNDFYNIINHPESYKDEFLDTGDSK